MMDEAETRASFLLLVSSIMIFSIIYLIAELTSGICRGESASVMYNRYQKILFGFENTIAKSENADAVPPQKVQIAERPLITKKQTDLPLFTDYLLKKFDDAWDSSVDITAKIINVGWRPIKQGTSKISQNTFKVLPNRLKKIIS